MSKLVPLLFLVVLLFDIGQATDIIAAAGDLDDLIILNGGAYELNTVPGTFALNEQLNIILGDQEDTVTFRGAFTMDPGFGITIDGGAGGTSDLDTVVFENTANVILTNADFEVFNTNEEFRSQGQLTINGNGNFFNFARNSQEYNSGSTVAIEDGVIEIFISNPGIDSDGVTLNDGSLSASGSGIIDIDIDANLNNAFSFQALSNSMITTSTGNISITSAPGLNVVDSTISSSTGDIFLTGSTCNSCPNAMNAVAISGTSLISSSATQPASSNITITGAAQGAVGVFVEDATIEIESGNLLITGDSASEEAVLIQGNAMILSQVTGASGGPITILGQSFGSKSGVAIIGNSLIESSVGDIFVRGVSANTVIAALIEGTIMSTGAGDPSSDITVQGFSLGPNGVGVGIQDATIESRFGFIDILGEGSVGVSMTNGIVRSTTPAGGGNLNITGTGENNGIETTTSTIETVQGAISLEGTSNNAAGVSADSSTVSRTGSAVENSSIIGSGNTVGVRWTGTIQQDVGTLSVIGDGTTQNGILVRADFVSTANGVISLDGSSDGSFDGVLIDSLSKADTPGSLIIAGSSMGGSDIRWDIVIDKPEGEVRFLDTHIGMDLMVESDMGFDLFFDDSSIIQSGSGLSSIDTGTGTVTINATQVQFRNSADPLSITNARLCGDFFLNEDLYLTGPVEILCDTVVSGVSSLMPPLLSLDNNMSDSGQGYDFTATVALEFIGSGVVAEVRNFNSTESTDFNSITIRTSENALINGPLDITGNLGLEIGNDASINSVISGTGTIITAIESGGTIVLESATTASDIGNIIVVEDGATLAVDGTVEDVIVETGGTLLGSGSILNAVIDGTISAGRIGEPSCLRVRNDLSFGSSSFLIVDIDSPTQCSGYDRITVQGMASSSGTTCLTINMDGAFQPDPNEEFVFIRNAGAESTNIPLQYPCGTNLANDSIVTVQTGPSSFVEFIIIFPYNSENSAAPPNDIVLIHFPPPIAVGDVYTLTRNAFVDAVDGVLWNDYSVTIPPQTSLSASYVSGSITAGTITLYSDGSFQFNPPTYFNGIITFQYTVSGGSLPSQPQTVTIFASISYPNPVMYVPYRIHFMFSGEAAVNEEDEINASLCFLCNGSDNIMIASRKNATRGNFLWVPNHVIPGRNYTLNIEGSNFLDEFRSAPRSIVVIAQRGK